ncbi:hypothetical protein FS749_000641 [Ceratobasidium sp. UAMH 11750]|nr:hypothetical protein FS749_000641 [Ceratobasidium sp. UAMH 11750]
MILELASDNPLHTLIRIPSTDNVLYRITSVQNLNHLNDLLGWTTTLSTPLSSGASVSSRSKARRDVATIVWDHDGETITFAESQTKISSHLVFDFQQRSQRPLEIEVREGLIWKGDMNGLHLMEGEVAVATLRPCRRFIHGRLVRKVLQRFDELDVSDHVIDRVGLNTIMATFTVITTARQRRFGIVPRRASIPDSSDSEVGSSVEYEDLVEPNSSEDDSQYDSEDPDAPSPHYTPPGTAQGAPVRASYTFTPTASTSDDATPRPSQSDFDDVLIVTPESRRPSAQSGVDVGFENDFNPNTPGSSKVSSTRVKSSNNKSRTKEKEKSDTLGPLPSALASLGLGIRSGRRRSAADPYATEESEQRLKKWGRSRGLSF